jgi:cytochrome c oxidase cbb3-type subunit 2
VYRASGCAECHTRQVRPANEGGDIARGWGKRRSVAQDYLYDTPVLLGNLRVGPDLANYGVRQTNVTEVLKLLYKPAAIGQGAMPAYPYLFKRTKLANGQKLSPGAIQIPGEPADIEITPKPEAEELAEYLVSLRADVPLFEAPIPGAQAKAALPADQGTNAPATNAPGTNAAAAPTGK